MKLLCNHFSLNIDSLFNKKNDHFTQLSKKIGKSSGQQRQIDKWISSPSVIWGRFLWSFWLRELLQLLIIWVTRLEVCVKMRNFLLPKSFTVKALITESSRLATLLVKTLYNRFTDWLSSLLEFILALKIAWRQILLQWLQFLLDFLFHNMAVFKKVGSCGQIWDNLKWKSLVFLYNFYRNTKLTEPPVPQLIALNCVWHPINPWTDWRWATLTEPLGWPRGTSFSYFSMEKQTCCT